MPTNPTTRPAALVSLANLLSDPDNPAQPRIWFPNPPPHLAGDLTARRQRHAQDLQHYRSQLRDLSRQTDIPLVWVTQDLWGNQTTEPI